MAPIPKNPNFLFDLCLGTNPKTGSCLGMALQLLLDIFLIVLHHLFDLCLGTNPKTG